LFVGRCSDRTPPAPGASRRPSPSATSETDPTAPPVRRRRLRADPALARAVRCRLPAWRRSADRRGGAPAAPLDRRPTPPHHGGRLAALRGFVRASRALGGGGLRRTRRRFARHSLVRAE